MTNNISFRGGISSKMARKKSVDKTSDFFSPDKSSVFSAALESNGEGDRSYPRGGDMSLSPMQDPICLNCSLLEARLQMLSSTHVSLFSQYGSI